MECLVPRMVEKDNWCRIVIAGIRDNGKSGKRCFAIVNDQLSDHSSVNNLISMDYDTSSAQDEIEPLTGHPCFTWILSPTNVKPRFQMIPSRKLVKILPSAGVPVVFHCRGKRWEMKYCGHRPFKNFETWKNFAVDNNLKAGDALVFELTDSEKMEFKVQILKGEIPSVAHPCREKGSSASPIVID